MKKFIVAITLLVATWKGCAQNLGDILRISRTDAIGSARVLGAGGAWGGVGADLSSASINPAGLGFYRRNELLGSMAVTANFADANYLGSLRNDTRTNFNIPNIGAVFSYVNQEKGKDAKTDWISASFAVGMNRIADFQQNTYYSGVSKNNSFGDYIAIQANGNDTNNLNDIQNLAWRTYLINNTTNKSDSFDSWFGRNNDNNYSVNQVKSTQLRGNMNEWYFGAASNISNFLYIGASVVLNTTNLTTTSTFSEEVKSKSISSNPYVSNVYTSSVNTTGSGVGGRFGFIISPIDYFRFGLSYQTPIRVNLNDTYSSTNTTNFSTKSLSATTGDINSTYQIITPGKLTLSGVIMIPQHGFISADYEMIDYRDGQIKSTEFQSYFDPINSSARQNLTQSNNLRIGGEYRWDNYRFRAGYNSYNSPYTDDHKSIKQQSFSAGLGMLWGNGYFIDAACIKSMSTIYNSPYDNLNYAQIDLTKYTFLLSAGVRF